MSYRLLFLLLFCFPLLSNAQDKERYDKEVVLLSPDIIAELNFEQEELIGYIQQVLEYADKAFKPGKKDTTQQDIILQVTIHRDKDPTIELSARAPLDEEFRQKALKDVNAMKCPRALFTDFAFRLNLRLNGGYENGYVQFTPKVFEPVVRETSEYNLIPLDEKITEIQRWSREDVLPFLVHSASLADTVFEGVVGFGKEVSEVPAKEKYSIDKLTSNNENYWRASMEMARGNHLIQAIKIFMLVSNGDLDRARRYAFTLRFFNDDASVATFYMDQLRVKLQLMEKEVAGRLEEGIHYHDKKKYDMALAVFDSILTIYPNSAWARYERFYTLSAIKTEKSAGADAHKKEWNAAKEAIYAADPMYATQATASSKEEGFQLFRRLELKELFKVEGQIKADYLNYADIAFDLEYYPLAAQMYWSIFSYFPDEDVEGRDILGNYMYCLQQMGVTKVREIIKGDWEERLALIAKEKEDRMKNHTAYKMFEE